MEQFEYTMPDGQIIFAGRDSEGNITGICRCPSCLIIIRENRLEWDDDMQALIELDELPTWIPGEADNPQPIPELDWGTQYTTLEGQNDAEESRQQTSLNSYGFLDLARAGTSPSVPREDVETTPPAANQHLRQYQRDSTTITDIINRGDLNISPDTVSVQYERPSTSPETPAKNPRRNPRAGSNGRQRRSTPLP